MHEIIKRKLLTAVISSLLFSLIFTFFDLSSFLEFFYLSFMLIVTYGLLTSLFSDWVIKKLAVPGSSPRTNEILAFCLHCFFGLIFLVFSLLAAVLFFIVDRLLMKVNIRWRFVILPIAIILLMYIILLRK